MGNFIYMEKNCEKPTTVIVEYFNAAKPYLIKLTDVANYTTHTHL